MTFSPDQTKLLTAPLSKANVKKNPRGYDYVEGWHAIAEANRIFGFDGWDRQTIEMVQLGDPELVGNNWRVGYRCRVRITVRAGDTVITRDGTGYGSGIVKDIRDAHESAAKEAETDAMKRALMTFGNPFGLALYDKEQVNVAEPVDESTKLFITQIEQTINDSNDAASLHAWWMSEVQKGERRKHQLDASEVDRLKGLVLKKIDTLKPKAA